MPPPFVPWPAPSLAGWTVLPTPDPKARLSTPLGLELGDVLLFCRAAPNLLTSAIVAAQQAAQPGVMSHACYTHVALYDGADSVFDAHPQYALSSRVFAQVAGAGFVRARRWQGITGQQQRTLVAEAHGLTGAYSFLRALTDGLVTQAALSLPYANVVKELTDRISDPNHRGRPFHCASLVDTAYLKALNVSFVSAKAPAVLPCVISADTRFDEVRIHW